MASLEKMEVNLEYSGGKMALGLVFSASMVSLVAVVPHQMAQYMM